MHPFTPVPRRLTVRRDLHGQRGHGRRVRWVRTAVLSLLGTLALVSAPLAVAPTVVPPAEPPVARAPLRDDPAARSAERAPTPSAPGTTTPTPAPVPAAAPPAPPPAAPPPPPAVDVPPAATAPAAPSLVDEIVTRTNAERAAAGLAPLAVSPCAAEQATARTAVLVAEDRFEHDPLEPVLAACGARAVGENLALGYPTATAVVAGWMGSEGHRANILNATYTQLGVGCTAGPKGQLCAQVFMG